MFLHTTPTRQIKDWVSIQMVSIGRDVIKHATGSPDMEWVDSLQVWGPLACGL